MTTTTKGRKGMRHRHIMEYNGQDMGCAACSDMYKTNRKKNKMYWSNDTITQGDLVVEACDLIDRYCKPDIRHVIAEGVCNKITKTGTITRRNQIMDAIQDEINLLAITKNST